MTATLTRVIDLTEPAVRLDLTEEFQLPPAPQPLERTDRLTQREARMLIVIRRLQAKLSQARGTMRAYRNVVNSHLESLAVDLDASRERLYDLGDPVSDTEGDAFSAASNEE